MGFAGAARESVGGVDAAGRRVIVITDRLPPAAGAAGEAGEDRFWGGEAERPSRESRRMEREVITGRWAGPGPPGASDSTTLAPR